MPGKKRKIEKISVRKEYPSKSSTGKASAVKPATHSFVDENPVEQISLGTKLITDSQSKLITKIKDDELLIQQLKKDNEEIISELQNKNSMLKSLNQKIFELNEALNSRESITLQMQSKILDADSIISRQKQEIEVLSSRVSEAEEENQKLKETMPNIDKFLSEKKKLDTALAEKEKTMAELNTRLMNLSSERMTSGQKFSEVMEKLAAADRIIRRLRTDNSELTGELKKLEEENIELGKKIAENNLATNFENMKNTLKEREDEIRELKKTILHDDEEKNAFQNKIMELKQQLSEANFIIKNFEKNIGERDKIDAHFKREIFELKNLVEDKETTIKHLRLHFSQGTQMDEQLSSDIINMRKKLDEKQNMLNELMARNKALVEMGRVSDLAAKETMELLLKLEKENQIFKLEIGRLKNLIGQQEFQHKRFVEDLKKQFEAQKQLMIEKSTDQEVSLRTRIRELEEGLKGAEKVLEDRDDKIKSLIKSMNEKSEQLISDLEASREIPRRVLEQQMPQLRRTGEMKIRAAPEKVAERFFETPTIKTKIPEMEAARFKQPITEFEEPIVEKPEIQDKGLIKVRIDELVSMIEIASQHDTPEKIRNSLLKSGYSKEEIDSAFEKWKSENNQ